MPCRVSQRTRHQRGQALHEFQRRHLDVRRAVAPGSHLGPRIPQMPNVPTLSETVLPGFTDAARFALFAPAKNRPISLLGSTRR